MAGKQRKVTSLPSCRPKHHTIKLSLCAIMFFATTLALIPSSSGSPFAIRIIFPGMFQALDLALTCGFLEVCTYLSINLYRRMYARKTCLLMVLFLSGSPPSEGGRFARIKLIYSSVLRFWSLVQNHVFIPGNVSAPNPYQWVCRSTSTMFLEPGQKIGGSILHGSCFRHTHPKPHCREHAS